MGDLDGVDAGGVEGGDDPADVVGVDAVADGVHAVAQGDVLDEELRSCSSGGLLGCAVARGDLLGDAQRGRGHDVEVAGVGGR